MTCHDRKSREVRPLCPRGAWCWAQTPACARGGPGRPGGCAGLCTGPQCGPRPSYSKCVRQDLPGGLPQTTLGSVAGAVSGCIFIRSTRNSGAAGPLALCVSRLRLPGSGWRPVGGMLCALLVLQGTSLATGLRPSRSGRGPVTALGSARCPRLSLLSSDSASASRGQCPPADPSRPCLPAATAAPPRVGSCWFLPSAFQSAVSLFGRVQAAHACL